MNTDLIVQWSKMIAIEGVTSLALAAALSLLSAPIVKLSARQISWRQILWVGFQSFLPAMFGIALTYGIYVDVLGKAPNETPALLIVGWFILAAWLLSNGVKKAGVVQKFPGVGTKVVVGLLAMSWIIFGLAFLIVPLLRPHQ